MPSDTKALTDFASFHQQYVAHYIQLADAKATAMFAVFGAVAAYVLSKQAFRDLLLSGASSGPAFGAWVAAILLLAAALCAFGVVIPRGKAPDPGTVFFGAVAKFPSAEDYQAHLVGLTAPELAKARIEHCHAVAVVCTAKYKMLRLSMWLGLAGALLAGAMIVVLDL